MNYTIDQQKEVSNKEALQGIKPYLQGELGSFGVVILLTLISALSNILMPYLTIIAIDNYIIPKNLNGLTQLLLVILLLYFFTAIVDYWQGRSMGNLAQKILFKIRADLFAHLQKLPLRFFNANKTGDIIARINNDTEKVGNFLSYIIFQFFSSALVFIGIGIFIFFINVPLALTLWAALGFVIIFTVLLNPWVKKWNKQALEANGEMSAVLDENLNNYKAVVAFNQQKYLRRKFEEANHLNFKRTIISQVVNSLFQPLYTLGGNSAQVAVVIVGIYLVAQNQITIGVLVGFVTYAQRLAQPLSEVGSSWGGTQSALAAWRRILQFLKIKSK